MSSTSGSAVLVAEGLSKSYEGGTVLEDLSFELQRGHVMGFLGPNGAGKTTSIRILTTILTPSKGRFEIDGIGSEHPADIRPRIGVLPRPSDCRTRSRASSTSPTSLASTDGSAPRPGRTPPNCWSRSV